MAPQVSMEAWMIFTEPFSSATGRANIEFHAKIHLQLEDSLWEKTFKSIFPKNEVPVVFSSYLRLTYEIKYFNENFEDNSK